MVQDGIYFCELPDFFVKDDSPIFSSTTFYGGQKKKEEPARVALAGSKRGGRGLCWEREEGKSYVTKSVARMFYIVNTKWELKRKQRSAKIR